jgi:hypothetical protein
LRLMHLYHLDLKIGPCHTIILLVYNYPDLTIGQRNGLKSFMKKTKDKKEYRRTQAVLKKGLGMTVGKTIANDILDAKVV